VAALAEDRLAAQLRGFGPLGLLAIALVLAGNALFVPFSALLVLAWIQLSGTPWPAIGYLWPTTRRGWVGGLAAGVAFGAALKLGMKALVMPLLGAPAVNPAYGYLTANAAALPAALYLVIVGAGFGEETVYRGFLFERLGKLLGTSSGARAVTVLLTSLWFGLIHYPEQGLAGAQQATITGLIVGTTYSRIGRLWPIMCAHAAFDLVAVAIIYWGLESQVAHLVFN